MSREQTPLLILGLGNVLCSDDGAGIAVIAALRRKYLLPAGVQVMDGGTLGLSLLPHLQDARAAILVDAVRAEAPPGTLLRLTGDDVRRAVGHRLSPHQIGVADLLDSVGLLGSGPERLVLLGVVPESIALGLGRTPPVAAQTDALVEMVVTEAAALGACFRLRQRCEGEALAAADAPPEHGSLAHVAQALEL